MGIRNAKFRTSGRFVKSRPQYATVIVERAANLVSVRPLRSRRSYSLPLSAVAEYIVWTVVRAEVAAKKAARKGGR